MFWKMLQITVTAHKNMELENEQLEKMRDNQKSVESRKRKNVEKIAC